MTKTFTTEDWLSDENQEGAKDMVLLIQFNEHNTPDPIVQVYETNPDGSAQLISTNVVLSNSNDVMVVVNTPFNGKVVIK